MFPQFRVYLSATQAKRIVNLLLLNNFYPVISYGRSSKGKESDELSYTGIRSLVMVRESVASASG